MATRIIEYGACESLTIRSIVPRALRVQAAMTATGTSAQSAAFGAGTQMICIQSDEAIYKTIGANPTATADHYRIVAGGEQFFVAVEGEKVAIKT